jgi:hypothetical protein
MSATKGPHARIRLRYQRGPSDTERRDESGAEAGSRGGAGSSGRREAARGSSRSSNELNARPIGTPYATFSKSGGQSFDDADAVTLAVLTAVATAASSQPARVLVLTVALASAVIRRRSRGSMTLRAVVFLLLAVASMARGAAAWHDLEPDRLGPFEGHATVVGDPQPYGAATRIVVELDGERFEIWVFGRGARSRLHEWQGGDRILVSGTRRALADERARRVASQHVVGRFDLEWAADRDDGTALARGVNRIRTRIEIAASHLPEPDGELFRGLVIGDDRDQPVEMVERFRASGLSHLTAVSGQNVY